MDLDLGNKYELTHRMTIPKRLQMPAYLIVLGMRAKQAEKFILFCPGAHSQVPIQRQDAGWRIRMKRYDEWIAGPDRRIHPCGIPGYRGVSFFQVDRLPAKNCFQRFPGTTVSFFVPVGTRTKPPLLMIDESVGGFAQYRTNKR